MGNAPLHSEGWKLLYQFEGDIPLGFSNDAAPLNTSKLGRICRLEGWCHSSPGVYGRGTSWFGWRMSQLSHSIHSPVSIFGPGSLMNQAQDTGWIGTRFFFSIHHGLIAVRPAVVSSNHPTAVDQLRTGSFASASGGKEETLWLTFSLYHGLCVHKNLAGASAWSSLQSSVSPGYAWAQSALIPSWQQIPTLQTLRNTHQIYQAERLGSLAFPTKSKSDHISL